MAKTFDIASKTASSFQFALYTPKHQTKLSKNESV